MFNFLKRVATDDNSPTSQPPQKSSRVDAATGSVVECSMIRAGYKDEGKLWLNYPLATLEADHKSDAVKIGRHLNWSLGTKVVRTDGVDWLVAYVSAQDMYLYPLKYEVELTLGAGNPSDRRVEKMLAYAYDDPELSSNEWKIVPIDDIVAKEYAFGGGLLLFARIKLSMPRCYDFVGSKPFSDVTIKIADTLFPMNRAVLSTHSPFFLALLNGQFAESRQDVVEIKEVGTSTFVTLFNVLFVGGFTMKRTVVFSVAMLADRFRIETIVDKCEALLLDVSPTGVPSLAQRLALAGKLELAKLQSRCLAQCTTPKILKMVRESAHYRDIPSAVHKLLCEKLLEVSPPSTFDEKPAPRPHRS